MLPCIILDHLADDCIKAVLLNPRIHRFDDSKPNKNLIGTKYNHKHTQTESKKFEDQIIKKVLQYKQTSQVDRV